MLLLVLVVVAVAVAVTLSSKLLKAMYIVAMFNSTKDKANALVNADIAEIKLEESKLFIKRFIERKELLTLNYSSNIKHGSDRVYACYINGNTVTVRNPLTKEVYLTNVVDLFESIRWA